MYTAPKSCSQKCAIIQNKYCFVQIQCRGVRLWYWTWFFGIPPGSSKQLPKPQVTVTTFDRCGSIAKTLYPPSYQLLVSTMWHQGASFTPPSDMWMDLAVHQMFQALHKMILYHVCTQPESLGVYL